jgi:hypothetical protein
MEQMREGQVAIDTRPAGGWDICHSAACSDTKHATCSKL